MLFSCAVCVMNSLVVSTFRKLENQAIKQQYNEIYNHELAHKSVAGALAGPIVIEKNSQGIPIGGHVSIKMPKLDLKNPNSTIVNAEKVIKSALAPFNPSSQDYKVASQAQKIRNTALNYKKAPKIDYFC